MDAHPPWPLDVSEEAGVRFLHFGSDWVQGAMRIARPWSLELEYTREMMLPLLLYPPEWPRRVLLIGLGAGSIVKWLWRHRPLAKLTVVDIDPRIEAFARFHFKLPDDSVRLRVHVDDGADFMATTRRRYDLILSDGFDADARANHLDSAPFYAACRNRLADDGMLCVNLLSRRRDFTRSVGRIRTAFDDQVMAMPSGDAGNAICMAWTPDNIAVPPRLCFDELREAARRLKKATALDLSPSLARLERAGRQTPG